ncbi:Protein Peter pan [Lucilia cuprina]|uniref:Protein Peter pan n=1 Tax=Lucilia cuprina TaxID=7375 RepID=A0A0L0CJZ4_LUCCU|nr:protein Peter pan [Lucilia cuprina]KAI8129649.1 Protein Peter pan [Lucilia cuprina]KAI8129650.1 Protein Peter pan [Lucilia cuprina]KNC32571.1 Protein Peter pan [Lucilia cuprina]
MGKTKKKHPKKRTAAFKESEPSELVEAPHSFIIHRGLSCPYITDLTLDFRRIMEPFTASELKEKKMNRIKDFVAVSSFFHVSHMGIFNKAATQLSFKVLRLPRGPTLTFKVHQFTLARDVISQNKKQFVDEDIFKHSPLVVMNNFTGDGKHLKLMASTFQNMFPAINLAEVNIATIRRCVLFSYNPQTSLVEMRHYSIQVVPVGLTKGVKKLVMGKIPNLAKCEDIADFIMQDGNVSESEAEDDENSQVVLPQTLKRKGNLENNKSAVQLYEIGPRMTMQLMKIEEGLLTGEVLYHDHIVKTEEEKEELRKMIEKKQKLKEQRKKQQNENRAKKLKELEKKNKNSQQSSAAAAAAEGGEEENNYSDLEDDAVYYKEEVGEEPDEELFKSTEPASRKRPKLPHSLKNHKKPKLEKKDSFSKDKNSFKDKKFGGKDKKGGFKNGFKEKKSFKFNKRK